MSDLLPCPFCGNQAAYCVNEEMRTEDEPHENYGGRWIECQGCRACTNIQFGENQRSLLRERWNRRATQSAAPVAARDAQDAARYRWLRPNLLRLDVAFDRFDFKEGHCRSVRVKESLLSLNLESVDAAIDRALTSKDKET
jgi:hypothetical protein